MDADQPKKDFITRCFSGHFDKIVYLMRYVFIVFFVVLGIIAAVISAHIGPLTEPEEYLPNDHELIVL